MATRLTLYNDSLLVLGQERLASLAEASTARYALDDAYDKAVAYCLEQGFWNFAMRTVAVPASDSVVPDFGATYALRKPVDWVRTLSMSSSERFDPPLLTIQDEGDYWWADVDPLYVRYVSNDIDYGLNLARWPESFADYVAHRLAVKTCKRITGSDPSDGLVKGERRALANSRAKDAMNEPPGFPPRGSWVTSRTAGQANTRSRS